MEVPKKSPTFLPPSHTNRAPINQRQTPSNNVSDDTNGDVNLWFPSQANTPPPLPSAPPLDTLEEAIPLARLAYRHVDFAMIRNIEDAKAVIYDINGGGAPLFLEDLKRIINIIEGAESLPPLADAGKGDLTFEDFPAFTGDRSKDCSTAKSAIKSGQGFRGPELNELLKRIESAEGIKGLAQLISEMGQILPEPAILTEVKDLARKYVNRDLLNLTEECIQPSLWVLLTKFTPEWLSANLSRLAGPLKDNKEALKICILFCNKVPKPEDHSRLLLGILGGVIPFETFANMFNRTLKSKEKTDIAVFLSKISEKFGSANDTQRASLKKRLIGLSADKDMELRISLMNTGNFRDNSDLDKSLLYLKINIAKNIFFLMSEIHGRKA